MVVDREMVERRLRKLEEYVSFLRELQKVSFDEFLSEHMIQASVERDLQLVIECVLDIGNHIIAAMGYREPARYQDVILILGEEGVLPQDFVQRFALVAGFRNILVHDYLELDKEMVYEKLQTGLEDFEEFAKYIASFLEERA